jgi:hypothetical protein
MVLGPWVTHCTVGVGHIAGKIAKLARLLRIEHRQVVASGKGSL